jgi:hypothetical protein
MLLLSMLSNETLHEHQDESKEWHVPDPCMLNVIIIVIKQDFVFHDFALQYHVLESRNGNRANRELPVSSARMQCPGDALRMLLVLSHTPQSVFLCEGTLIERCHTSGRSRLESSKWECRIDRVAAQRHRSPERHQGAYSGQNMVSCLVCDALWEMPMAQRPTLVHGTCEERQERRTP